jgi:hypothetical protein
VGGNIARIEEMRNACTVLIGRPEGKVSLGSLGVDVKITLEWILGK